MDNKWINQIPGFEHIEGYKIYTDGKIISYLRRNNHKYIISDKPQKTLKPFSAGRKYAVVELKRKIFPVHRLVAMAFIPNPENKPQVNHKDTNKFNNDVSNLEWVTNSENQLHAVKMGVHVSKRGDNHYRRQVGYKQHNLKPIYQIDSSNRIVKRFDSFKQASEELNINYTTISKAVNNPKRTAAGFKWLYV